MPGVMILHATCGGGHKAAALALRDAFASEGPDVEVRVEDALDGMPRRMARLYTRVFELAVAHAPHAYGEFFRLTRDLDRSGAFRLARRVSGALSCGALSRMIREAKPDAIVCTHFLPLNVAMRERRAGRTDARVYCVVTDYTAHGLWRQPSADITFCAPGPSRRELIAGRVPADRIVASGIPVAPAFGEPYDAAEAKVRAGLPADRPTVVMLAGGAGMGPLPAVLREVGRAVGRGAELVVVCGSNEGLRAEAEEVARGLQAHVRVVGFVSPIVDLLRAADVIVTKPGGLTTSEALALGKPLVFYSAAPGQESANARFVTSNGAGIDGRTPRGAADAVLLLASDPEGRERIGRRARELSRPDAAAEISRAVLTDLDGRRGAALPAPAPTVAVARAG